MDKVEDTLNHMLKDLNSHHRKRKELLVKYVNKRLDKGLHNYYEELMASYDMLVRRDAQKVLKKMFPKGGDKQ